MIPTVGWKAAGQMSLLNENCLPVSHIAERPLKGPDPSAIVYS